MGGGVSGDPNPTSRALTTLELIQSSPGITAERLSASLGVSERAARRYVTNLREAGIPIVSVRGPYGGYRVGRGLRPPPLMLSAPEALALVGAPVVGGCACGVHGLHRVTARALSKRRIQRAGPRRRHDGGADLGAGAGRAAGSAGCVVIRAATEAG